MDNIKGGDIYDIGYGITNKADFQTRLIKFFPARDVVIVDVRKPYSGSRNGKWAYVGSACMGKTCTELGMEYRQRPGLANAYGNTKTGFSRYAHMLEQPDMRHEIDWLAKAIQKGDKQYCLLCAELKPYTGDLLSANYAFRDCWTGRRNCHRVLIAAQLTARLWYDHKERWTARHLY